MKWLIAYLRRYRDRTHLRPWALAAPIVVLLISLPLLRPLRHPTPSEISNDESARLSTVLAIVEHHTLALDESSPHAVRQTIRVGDKTYADQPPVFAALLGAGYWVMTKIGLTFRNTPVLSPYLLTVLGSTLPVAGVAALVYRMGRLFELSRMWRSALAMVVVSASGLLSYATVLNSHAPAAALVMCSAACLIHIAIIQQPNRSALWLALAGLCAALASVIDLAAVVFMILLAMTIFAMRWRPSLRIAGVLLYIVGCTPPLVFHAVLNIPITGDLRPGSLHPELASTRFAELNSNAPAVVPSEEEDEQSDDSFWLTIGKAIGRVLASLFGTHGILSHFPVMIFAIAGVAAVMHRHWPGTTKLLAGATVGGAVVVILLYAWLWNDSQEPMFGPRWFIVFLPLLLFWSGAWLRKKHHVSSWVLASVLLAFSVFVTIIGATYPFPREGFTGYTVTGALKQLIHPQRPPVTNDALAGY